MKKLLVFPLLLLLLSMSVAANNVNKRIQFARGAYSATVKGRWFKDPNSRGETFDRYMVGASKGQTMTVQITSTASSGLFIWTQDYNNGPSWNADGTKYSKTFVLPNNGDYNIDVAPFGESAKDFNYTMTVTIK